MLTGDRVYQSHRLTSAAYLHGLTALVLQVYGSFGLVDIICVVLVKLS